MSRQRLIIQDPEDEIRLIPLCDIYPSKYQIRRIDANLVKELARSIAHLGLLQPVVLRLVSQDHYQIVFGMHRVEACRHLQMTTIRAIVRNISADDAFLASVAENLQRNADIDAFEEAKGYQALIENGWTQTRISEMIGKSDSYVSDRLTLVRRLHPDIAAKLEDSHRNGILGQITASHAQRLARVKSPMRQLELANLIEEAKLSVRDVENVLRKRSARGRFFVKVRRRGIVAIPALLAKRLRIEEGNVLEARIRHGKLTFTLLQASNLLRLHSKADQENQCEANVIPIGDFHESS